MSEALPALLIADLEGAMGHGPPSRRAAMLRKVESLEVKDGTIVLKVRAKGAASPRGPAAEKELPGDVLAPPPSNQPKAEPVKTETPKS